MEVEGGGWYLAIWLETDKGEEVVVVGGFGVISHLTIQF